MNLLHKSPVGPGLHRIVGHDNSPMRLLALDRGIFGKAGDALDIDSESREHVITVLGGKVTVTGKCPAGEFDYRNIGQRDNIFGGTAASVYVPRGAEYKIQSESENADIAISSAPAGKDKTPFYAPPSEVVVKVAGRDNWQRDICTAIGPDRDCNSLLVGETWSPEGKWSGWPPHKHDTADAPRESFMEEVYMFLLDPPQGFAMTRVYNGPDSPQKIDEAYVIRDGDTISIPYGYHPVVAGPGYKLRYLWMLAGPDRVYGMMSYDKQHEWIINP